MVEMINKREAQCPECDQWSEIVWQDDLPPGGFWWKNSGCCPKCNLPIAVESECEFRTVQAERRSNNENRP